MTVSALFLFCFLTVFIVTAQAIDSEPESTCEPTPISFQFNQFEGAECPTGKSGALVTVKITANCQQAIFEVTVCRKEGTNRLRFAIRKLETCIRSKLARCEDRRSLQRCSERRLSKCSTNFIPA